MKIQAIEKLKLHLSDNRTRICIDEVLSCFYSKNMRSAVVMLYVTTISDVYYKLCDLVEIYNDTTAKAIKDNVKQPDFTKVGNRNYQEMLSRKKDIRQ